MTSERYVTLTRSFASRYGAPAIEWIDAEIFRRTYFTHCLECTYCNDSCCQYGVDVDLVHYRRIMEHAKAIEAYTGIDRSKWFTGEYEEDPEVPGGGSRRTAVKGRGCVFLNPGGRGCLLHGYCLEHGIEFRELKSLVDCLFPASFYDDTLTLAEEVDDKSLVCLGTGPTIYRGVRDDLLYFFGAEFVEELDGMEKRVLGLGS
jgi:hypothetical protein